MLTFVILTNILFLTSLIAILSQSLQKVRFEPTHRPFRQYQATFRGGAFPYDRCSQQRRL